MTTEEFAGALVAIVSVYLAAGLVFGIFFVLRGVGRIDPQAQEGSWGFRLAILPGVAALWPILARRWLRGDGPPTERSPHRELTTREPRR